MTDPMWRLMIHGGAGMLDRARLSQAQDTAARAGLMAALAAGDIILAAGGSAVDAVIAAVCVLEDDPSFNAGRGAVLGYDGAITLDAAIMDGASRAAGSAAGVRHTRNPVRLAHAVMTRSPHVMLSGVGADEFSAQQGLDQVSNDWFEIPERRRQLEEMRTKGTEFFDVDLKYGTVGAVACDAAGHVAAATSTGGLTGKRWGRIGDSPLIGAGTVADDRSCAISATGAGEFFTRASVAHEISARMRFCGETAEMAAQAALDDVAALGGHGGVIVVTPGDYWAFVYNTPGMYRGISDSAGSDRTAQRRVAIYGDEAI
jgi:L-asparaginase / beta-aspartyl-peptidase